MSEELIQQFKKNLSQASYHYADDSGREWGQGRTYEDKAKEMFNEASEELKEEYRKICPGYLISGWWK